jgi:hypothetical protein
VSDNYEEVSEERCCGCGPAVGCAWFAGPESGGREFMYGRRASLPPLSNQLSQSRFGERSFGQQSTTISLHSHVILLH